MTDAPERIWIEHGDECPYFYEEDELHEAGSPVTEFVRADLIEAMEAENQQLSEILEAARFCLDFMAAGEDEAAKMAKLAISAMDRAALRSSHSLICEPRSPAMDDLIDIPDLASDLSAIAMYIIKSDDPDTHGELQEAFAAALAPFEAENQRLREALAPFAAAADDYCSDWMEDDYHPNWAEFFVCGDFRRARNVLRSTETSHDD